MDARLVTVGVIMALAGCTSDAGPVAGLESPVLDNATTPPVTVVVADIGPGANLYHESHRRPDWTEHPCHRVPAMPCDLPALNLTLGADYGANLEADRGVWQEYVTDQPYWIPGTNLLVMSSRVAPSLAPGHGHSFHGSATAGAVNDACRDCYILVYQDSQSLDGEPVRRIAQELPWVDLVTSTNWPGDLQRTQDFYLEGSYAEATRAIWESGRLFFGATGNTPVSAITPIPYPHIMLPPWVVLVGGAHSECSATEFLAGKPAEFVGNFTQKLPAAQDVQARSTVAGTSFAAPATAGMFGHALMQIRLALADNATAASNARAGMWAGTPVDTPELQDGVLTNEELRGAMALAARWFDTTDYGGCPPGELYAGALPATPTPWVGMGWGYVGTQEAEAAAAHLLCHERLPGKPQAEDHMAALEAARSTTYPY